jgi:hypothetical protein
MNSINENNCSICIEPLTISSSKQLNCKHEFHLNCITNWYSVQQKCPICRNLITPNEVNITEPCYVEIMSDDNEVSSSYQNMSDNISLSSSYQITSQNSNHINIPINQEINTDSVKNYKSLKIIISLFVFLGIIGSFTANIFCQNNFITEIKNYIEYTNNNTIDYNVTEIDYNVTVIKQISSDSFYIVCAIIYMICMLILTTNYICKLNMELTSMSNFHYFVFYSMTTIMFCTHLYYIADVFSYINESKYPNFKEFGDIKALHHNYLITSMTSLAILIFSFIIKFIKNLNLSVYCCCNMCIYCGFLCKCKFY